METTGFGTHSRLWVGKTNTPALKLECGLISKLVVLTQLVSTGWLPRHLHRLPSPEFLQLERAARPWRPLVLLFQRLNLHLLFKELKEPS